jgi:hypothetical protein
VRPNRIVNALWQMASRQTIASIKSSDPGSRSESNWSTATLTAEVRSPMFPRWVGSATEELNHGSIARRKYAQPATLNPYQKAPRYLAAMAA